MRKRYDRLKQRFRSHDDDFGSANTPDVSQPAAPTTQTPNSFTQLTGSTDDSAGGSRTAPPIEELSVSTVPLQTAPRDQDTCLSLSEQLWAKAYDGLKEKESGLVQEYEKILSKVQAEWTDTVTPSEIDSLQHCKNDEARQMWRVVYAGLERTKRQAEYKENASNFMEAINNIKGLIDKVAKYSAEASVVWVGVSLGLEVRRRNNDICP